MFEKSDLSTGIEVLWLIGIVAIILKLCNILDWQWWLITLPFWGVIAFFIIKILIEIIHAVVSDKMKHRKENIQSKINTSTTK